MTGNHNITITTNTTQHAEFFHSLIFIFSISFSIYLAEIDGIADYSIYFPLFVAYYYGDARCKKKCTNFDRKRKQILGANNDLCGCDG